MAKNKQPSLESPQIVLPAAQATKKTVTEMKNPNHNTICHAILVLLALLYFHKGGKNNRDITTFIVVFLVY